MSVQPSSVIVMIRPHRFRSAADTSVDNAFQTAGDAPEIAEQALAGFDGTVAALQNAGITVHDFDDFGDRILALSSRALNTLTVSQRNVMEQTARLPPLDIPAIEITGGSVRCMLAGADVSCRPEQGPKS